MLRTCIFSTVLLTILASTGWGKRLPSPAYRQVMDVANSAELSKDQKIARLKELAAAEETRMTALWQLEALDSAEAMRTAVAAFRANQTPREVKLRLGHFLLERNRPERKDFPDGFVQEFAAYLVGLVVDGGEAEFCRRLPEHPLTAVGEYAYLASDFDGYQKIDFTPFKDARVAAVLTRCLDAPDNVFSEDQGDCIRGKPGELTGRNTARQQIPVALAKLGAVQAVEPLRRILRQHHDWYLRDNAAYALARLQPPADHEKLVAEMRRSKVVDPHGRVDTGKDRYLHLYAFGRGLLQRGDDGGVEFLSFEYSVYNLSEGLSGTVYMLEQRINDLKETRSPKLEGFCKQAFAHERVMALFMWNQTKFKADDYDLSKAALRIEGLFDSLCQMIEANRLAVLRPAMERVAKDSSHEVIRRRAERCAGQLGEAK